MTRPAKRMSVPVARISGFKRNVGFDGEGNTADLPVVLTDTAPVAVVVPSGVIEVGWIEQFVPAGCPCGHVQLNIIVWLNPFTGATVNGIVAV